jgi:hypothetical protein
MAVAVPGRADAYFILTEVDTGAANSLVSAGITNDNVSGVTTNVQGLAPPCTTNPTSCVSFGHSSVTGAGSSFVGASATVAGATASATSGVDLATGTMHGSIISAANQASGGSESDFADTVTFNIPGATTTTVTNIGISFNLDGSFSNTSGTNGAEVETYLIGDVVGASTFDIALNINPNGIVTPTASGWLTENATCQTSSCFDFDGTLGLVGANPEVIFQGRLLLACGNGPCDLDYSNTAAVGLNLPSGVTYTSDSGVFLTQNPNAPTSVPEPSSWGLFGLGTVVVGLLNRRRLRPINPAAITTGC